MYQFLSDLVDPNFKNNRGALPRLLGIQDGQKHEPFFGDLG